MSSRVTELSQPQLSRTVESLMDSAACLTSVLQRMVQDDVDMIHVRGSDRLFQIAQELAELSKGIEQDSRSTLPLRRL
ncbi:hypothetical protein [Schlesneria sp. T3-172]|uniref:hypothetical protein n=1 Tax=Schlesneria sphaerica TaxID=3373610 RepID=UPI0037C83CE5